MEENKIYTIKQAAEQLGVSTRKVRHYCGLGLVPGIKRTQGGQRLLTEKQLNQVGTMIALRGCGITMAGLRRYAALQREGSATAAERISILSTKKRQLWQEYEELQAQIDFLERQIAWLESEEER